MTGAGTEEQPIQWGAELEVALFYAMRKHKPVGVNRNFHMMCIYEKLLSSTSIKISSKQIWAHLDTMYDMAALHESEVVPFPNKETNFQLPDELFGELKKERRSSERHPSTSEEDKRETKGKTSSLSSAEKENNKRKRTRQSAGTPNETSAKRRR